MKKRENIAEVLKRYLQNEGSDQDENNILQSLDNIKEENEIREESFKFWEGMNPDQSNPDYNGDNLLNRIHHNINLENNTLLVESKPETRFLTYITRIAASLFIPLAVGSIILFHQNKSFKDTLSWAEIHAPYGTRTDFSLPDGSTGRLNGGSSLKFPVRFIGKTRNVELKGEAYFNIVSDQKKPLIVSTTNIDVKVTGTSFNIMAYPDDQKAEITLERGIIELIDKKGGTNKSLGILKPDESFIYDYISDKGEKESVNVADRISWLNGKLTFKYEPFEEVIRKLNRWYNVNIIIKDKALNGFIYYGTFQNETFEEVLNLLRYTAPIKFINFERERNQDGTFQKKKVEIYSKN